MFTPVSVDCLVGLFVTPKLLHGFPQNLDRGWVQTRIDPHFLSVQIQIKRLIQDIFFSLSSTLQIRAFIDTFIYFSVNTSWIFMKTISHI